LQATLSEYNVPEHCEQAASCAKQALAGPLCCARFSKTRQDLLVYDHMVNAPLETKGSTNDFYHQLFLSLAADWGLLREWGEDEDYGLSSLFSSRIPISQLEQERGIRSNLASLFGGDHQAAGSLIDQPMQRQGQSWPDWLRQLILRLCGGHPKLLQIICFALFPYSVSGDLESAGTEERLMAALQSQLFDVLLKLAAGAPVDTSGGQFDELQAPGYLLPLKGSPDHCRPFGELQHLYLQVCGRQQKVWPVVEQAKEALQDLVEKRYQAASGRAWPVAADRYPSGIQQYDWGDLPTRWQRLQRQPFVSWSPANR